MKPYVPKDASLTYKFAELQNKKPVTLKWDEMYDNSFVLELDKSGFIDELFKGVAGVNREVVPHN